MNQSKRGPHRLVTAEYESVSGTFDDRLHPSAIRLDASSLWVVMTATVHRSPEVRIKLEIRAAPIIAHGAKDVFEMSLCFRISAVKRIPWTTSPPSKGDTVRTQWFSIGAFYKPVRMLLKEIRSLFSNK